MLHWFDSKRPWFKAREEQRQNGRCVHDVLLSVECQECQIKGAIKGHGNVRYTPIEGCCIPSKRVGP